MRALPFDKPGRFFRGNLHTHSTNSDGGLPAAEVSGVYRKAGYDFFSLTDHFIERYGFPISDTRAFRSDSFTTILGAELHTDRIALGSPWHILAVGLPLDFAKPPEGEAGASLAARARAAGAFVAAAHPYWYGLTLADIVALGEVDAIETFNTGCHVENERGDSWYFLDMLLSRGRRYFACATDDAHLKPGVPDHCRSWVHVKATHLDPEALVTALRAGHFYSSTGPSIHDIRLWAGKEITVACSPCSAVIVTGYASQRRRVLGEGLTEATLPLGGFASPYLRVTVRDDRGERAWSNPMWL